MPRVNHVQRAQQRYATKPVIDPETGLQKVTPVMNTRTGEPKLTKSGRPVLMLEWKNDEVSADGQWVIDTDYDSPVWRSFDEMPAAVRKYVEDHPGDTDAWTGHYSVSLDEMHAQAEFLLRRSRKK